MEAEMSETEKKARSKADKRKQSLYFPVEMLEEIIAEATRLDRSLSWIMQKAWQIARPELRKMPSVNDYIEEPTSDEDEDEDEE